MKDVIRVAKKRNVGGQGGNQPPPKLECQQIHFSSSVQYSSGLRKAVLVTLRRTLQHLQKQILKDIENDK